MNRRPHFASPRRFAPRSFALLAAGLGLGLLAQRAQATQDKAPQVTNGGYMQTQTPDGQSVPLPLKHTDVQAEISGLVASVKVTQQFHNPYEKPIEAVYVFPLPQRSAIYKMTAKIGKRVIKGLVKKRAEAREMYERAKAAGKTAALLEQERPNIFTQSISNIMPGDDIRVEIQYAEDLFPEDGRYEFVFPMVVGPRYVGGGETLGTRSGTGWGKDTTRIPDASRITPPLLRKGLRPGNDIAVQVQIRGGVAIQQVQVVAHQAKVENTGSWAAVQLDPRDSIPNKDFVLRYQLAGAQPEVAVLPQYDSRGGHFLLMLQPKAKMAQRDIAPREYIFVIDTSGSQAGFPLEQSKEVVRKCLATIRPQDTFNLIRFAGAAGSFAPQVVPATAQNVQQALTWINGLYGGGGTEFLPALQLALTPKKDPSRARIVLFSTDGYIGYENQVLKYLRDHGNAANVFPLGVGSSVNRFLIDGMARIGVGRPFYLLNTEQPAAVVERIFSTISRPSLTSIDIDWGGLDVEEVTPAAVPDLFGDVPVFVAGRYRKGGSGTVTVRGRLAGRPFVKRVQVTLPSERSAKNEAVAYLWARRQIADWSDLGAIEPQRQKETERAITRTALKYNLMSQYTSFIAVDHVVRNQGGQQVTVPVPVALPEGVSEQAAPSGAYVGNVQTAARGYGGRAMGGGRYHMARKSVAYSRRPMAPPMAAPVATAADSAGADEDRADQPAKPADKRVRPRPKPPTQHRGLRLALGPDVRVSGAASGELLPRLRLAVARLAPRIRSLTAGQAGTLKLRLTIDASGRVQRVAFVSGTLMLPSLRAELQRAFRGLRFGVLSADSTATFTLHFS